MNEAMTRIRYELGKDAVIISQRKIRKQGIKGFFGKKVIEVTAAADNTKKDNDNIIYSIDKFKKAIEKEELFLHDNGNTPKPLAKEKIVKNNDNNLEIIKEMHDIKNLISDMMNKKDIENNKIKSEIQNKLEDNDINDKVIENILNEVKKIDEDIEETKKVKIAIEKMISISKAEMKGPIVLVGPTGVGKTTTIAKLAGKFSLIDKKRVGLITIDTYRIGAVEQLKTYADIMNIPFKVIFTLNQIETALESMKDCDVILIDTTGRSSKNIMQISELRAFVEKIKTDNIHLVLSCTTKNKDIDSIVQGYSVLGYNNIIITKLDETSTYGSILNILYSAKKPLSFITTGQNVPEDIKNISASEISSLILGEDSIC
jgi:flagellar biosynthesis protein FlhF